MEVKFADTFFPSFKRMIQSENPWHWRYYRAKWYDWKRFLWAKRKYRRVLKDMNSWDYGSILRMMEFQLGILADHIEHNGMEVEESRMPKVEKMRKAIKLIHHKQEDDYAERCGYEDVGFKFVDQGDGTSTMEPEDEEIARHNRRVFKEAHELEEKEWNELFETLKDMRLWWD